jgi:phosphate transport system substrate-binding protein
VKRTSFRRAIVPGVAVIALAAGLSACGAGNEDSGSSSDSDLSGTLTGEGSSAQEAAQTAWRAGFQGDNSGVTVNYTPSGSGAGREKFIAGAVDFAGSDSYLKDDDEATELSDATERCGGEDPVEVPAYVSPIAVVFNVEGVDSLNLSAETIGKIFNEKITTWNDPAIKQENPDAALPSTKITPVHRSDESGTTENFTDYLEKASNGGWPHEKDKLWPLKSGEAAQGTSGVIQAVTEGDGSIGYADESQVGDLNVVSIKVGEEYVAPSAEAAAKVLAVSPRAETATDVGMAIDVDRTTTESGAYPLLLASYLIACQHYDDQGTADLVKGYLTYVLSEEGQQTAADNAGSAPLDSELSDEATAIVEKISAK